MLAGCTPLLAWPSGAPLQWTKKGHLADACIVNNAIKCYMLQSLGSVEGQVAVDTMIAVKIGAWQRSRQSPWAAFIRAVCANCGLLLIFDQRRSSELAFAAVARPGPDGGRASAATGAYHFVFR
jgi:hypothetical protein